MSIAASQLSNSIPSVLTSAAGVAALSGLILTANTTVPLGAIAQFTNPTDVGSYFGPTSPEFNMASIYFAGYLNSTKLPGLLTFSQYPTAAVSAYLRSASQASTTLAQLQAITPGTLSITVDGVVKTSTSINLAGATSFSNAATLIGAAFTGGPTVTFNSQLNTFVFTSTTTGASSTISFGTGAIATPLGLTQALGAVTSQGSIAFTPASAMTAITALTLNFAPFMTIFEPVLADKVNFGVWTSQQQGKYVYAAWDSDINATTAGNLTAFGPQIIAQSLSGSQVFTADPVAAATQGTTVAALALPLAAAALAYYASLDFNRLNGRTTLAFRQFGGLATGVSNSSTAQILIANGYNFYGDYANSTSRFQGMQPGSIGGKFAWSDSYANQIWMNANFAAANLSLMQNLGTIPYNPDGYGAIDLGLQGPISAALNFGAIRTNVPLSGTETAQVNSNAGVAIAPTLASRGWYLQILDPGVPARISRITPIITLWYMDGGSVQQMSMASINIQ